MQHELRKTVLKNRTNFLSFFIPFHCKSWQAQCFCFPRIYKNKSAKGCFGGSVGLVPNLGSGHDRVVHEFEPHIGLCADSSEPGACLGCCVSLSAPPLLALCLYLSKMNKNVKKIKKRINQLKREKCVHTYRSL